jgi:ABC-type sugar transport system substrate-binding protein
MRTSRRLAGVVSLAVAVAVVTGCSSSSSGDGGAQVSTAGQATDAAGLRAATSAVESALQQSPSLGISTPLKTIPRGKVVDFLECGVSDCTQNAGFLEQALAPLGVKLEIIQSGMTIESGIAALQQAIADKPDGIVFGAMDLAPLTPELLTLQKMHIPVVGFANSGAPIGAMKITFLSDAVYGETGQLAANWIIRNADGKPVNIAYLNFPVYGFSGPELAGFRSALSANCPSCTIHVIPNQPSDVGTVLQTRITSYLQANPGTKYVYDSSGGSFLTGVPAALDTAGLTNITIGSCCPSAANFEAIKNGSEAFTIDLSGYQAMWYSADAIARLMTGQSVAGIVDQDLPWNLIIDKTNVNNINFTRFPTGPGPLNMEAKFEELWGVGS